MMRPATPVIQPLAPSMENRNSLAPQHSESLTSAPQMKAQKEESGAEPEPALPLQGSQNQTLTGTDSSILLSPHQILPYLTDPLQQYSQWWKSFHQYYSYLLRLHPDHPTPLRPEDLDQSLLQGPAAQIALLFRNIIECNRVPGVHPRADLPDWVYLLLPFLKCLESLEFWEGTFMLLMPPLMTSITSSSWSSLILCLRWISHSMMVPLSTISTSTNLPSSGPKNAPNVIREEDAPKPAKPPIITHELAQEIRLFGGETYQSEFGIRIVLPDKAWLDFRKQRMDPKTRFSFKIAALLFMKQFNQKDLRYVVKHLPSEMPDLRAPTTWTSSRAMAWREILLEESCLKNLYDTGYSEKINTWVEMDLGISNGVLPLYGLDSRGYYFYHTNGYHCSEDSIPSGTLHAICKHKCHNPDCPDAWTNLPPEDEDEDPLFRVNFSELRGGKKFKFIPSAFDQYEYPQDDSSEDEMDIASTQVSNNISREHLMEPSYHHEPEDLLDDDDYQHSV